MSTKLELLTPEEVKALEVSRQRPKHSPVCKCPKCGEVIPCERTHMPPPASAPSHSFASKGFGMNQVETEYEH
jgi:hypothetical protein